MKIHAWVEYCTAHGSTFKEQTPKWFKGIANLVTFEKRNLFPYVVELAISSLYVCELVFISSSINVWRYVCPYQL